MESVRFIIFVFFFLFSFHYVWTANISCRPTVAGRTYDLTPLIAKNGSFAMNAKFNGTTVWFVAQICGDVVNPPSACTVPAPFYQLSQDKTKCMHLGQTMVSVWDENPYKDGIYLTHYHGFAMNNVQHVAARIYFVCTPGAVGTLSFEHMRSCTNSDDNLVYGGQYHFFVGTKYVC